MLARPHAAYGLPSPMASGKLRTVAPSVQQLLTIEQTVSGDWMALASVSSVGLWSGPSGDGRPRAEPFKPWVKKKPWSPPKYDAARLLRLREQADAEADALVERVQSRRKAAGEVLMRQLEDMERHSAQGANLIRDGGGSGFKTSGARGDGGSGGGRGESSGHHGNGGQGTTCCSTSGDVGSGGGSGCGDRSDGRAGRQGGGSSAGRNAPSKRAPNEILSSKSPSRHNRRGGGARQDGSIDESDPEAVERERLRVLDVDWPRISGALPMGKDPESSEQRAQLFTSWDLNGNGYLSLAEVDTHMKELMYDVTAELLSNNAHSWNKSWKPVIMRAFVMAKDSNARRKKGKKRHVDYIERDEFRLLLCCMREYFELYIAFSRIDSSSDRKIGVEEFVKSLPVLAKWGIIMTEEQARNEFIKIDENGGGSIMFEEFIAWATENGLDLDDDDDDDAWKEYENELSEDMIFGRHDT